MFDRIASPNVVAFLRGKKSTEKSLQRLKTTLYAAGAVLHDADQKQITDSAVKNWLDDLRDAVYHADDLIDEIWTQASTQVKVESCFYCSFNLNVRKINFKIDDVVDRLESTLKHRDILGLRDGIVRENWSGRHQSTSLVDEFDVFGRDNEKEAILELLLSDDIDDNKISVIPIVGMGGIGKTTMAQVAYNNDQVKQKFDLRAWVCVSEEFDVSKISKSIIESITSHACDMKDLNLLQLDLKEKLPGKKFLIRLDDIWNENYLVWDLLRRPFQSGTEGSKILVTTRSEKVALFVQTLSAYRVSQLSDSDCWLIFAKHACLYVDSVVDPNLERIGKDIIKKCKGLPLVAKTLGGLLRFKRDIGDWNNILKSEVWDLSEEESEILPALRISYHYLSPQLKQCFLYCSMFPKDYEFEKEESILWWMAEGFLEPSMTRKTLEQVGEEYFDDLVSRSFFQPLYKYDRFFVIHDLIHDLATFEARKFYSYSCSPTKENEITDMTRHVFCRDGDFSSISKAKSLRTILVRKGCGGYMPSNTISKLKRLRVLSLYNVLSGALPDSINKLIHLRYLNLSRTSIKKLPDTLCLLYNLQTLIMRDCDGLIKLPNDMQKLVNLRYLDASHSRLQSMPKGIGELKELHFLSDFVLDRAGASIIELGGLQNLSSSLKIKNLQYVANGGEALEARLVDKQSIKTLSLIWNDAGDIVDSRDILDNLQPHVNLEFLVIYGYSATAFPKWLGCPLYCKMAHLILYNCLNCNLLPPLGQLPSLKMLEIEGFHALVKIGPEFYKYNDDPSLAPPFPSLEMLEFRNMISLQEWWSSYPTSAFPQLKHLALKDCPRLSENLPCHLPDLKTLRIDGCEQLAASIPGARAIYISGCRKMEFCWQHNFELVEFVIITNSCETLTCLSLDNLPNLQQLIVTGCENLKSVLYTKLTLQYLKHVKLIDCPNLASFLLEGLCAPNMTHLGLEGCYNLKLFLDHKMNLPMLQHISLSDCPGIQWIPGRSLLCNLMSLYVDHWAFSRIYCCMEWQSLCSLASLSINGKYDDSVLLFPEECLLPPSLTFLSISNYSSLETLDCRGFVNLTSLQELRIRKCPKLQRVIGKTLPASLIEFNLYGCSLLGEQCWTKNGEIWPKISHIPNISIDNNRVL